MSNLRKILDGLVLPPAVLGDDVAMPGPDDPHLFYADMNGRPFNVPGYSPGTPKGILNDYDEAARLQSEAIRKSDPDAFSRAYFSDGTSVLTSYLGWNEQYFHDRPPLVWETLIYLQGRDTWQMRYVTKAAAHQAHEKIVKALERSGLKLTKREKGIPR